MPNGIRLSNSSNGRAWLNEIENPESMWSGLVQAKKLQMPLKMAYIQTKKTPASVPLEMKAQWCVKGRVMAR